MYVRLWPPKYPVLHRPEPLWGFLKEAKQPKAHTETVWHLRSETQIPQATANQGVKKADANRLLKGDHQLESKQRDGDVTRVT